MAAAPESASGPLLPVVVLSGGARLDHASPLDAFAVPAPVRASARTWRAVGAPLKIVKKILTAPT